MKEGYSSQQYKVYFDADPSGEGDSLAASFADFISEVDDGLEVERVRPSPEHMDFGSVVLLILSAPAIVAVAKGIEAWFARHPSAKIKVQKPDGTTMVVENVRPKDARSLSEALIKNVFSG